MQVLVSLKQVFRNKGYVVFALGVAYLTVVLSAWLPNFRLIGTVLAAPDVGVMAKFNVLKSLVGSLQTNFTFFSAIATFTVALLFAMNIAMVVYHIKQRKHFLQASGMATSFSGLLSGLFGVGCATCGTIVLAPLLSVIGAGGLIAILPFKGQEFSLVSILILGGSIFWVAKKIQEPLECRLSP